jgi:hypothetical protein
MQSVPMSQSLFGFVHVCSFGVPTLSNQVGEWGQHFTMSHPEISVVLDYAQESMELIYILWWCGARMELPSLAKADAISD